MNGGAQALAEGVSAGDVRSLARVCRLVDDAVGGYREILKTLFPRTGNAWTIGITGMPGAGKSTLTDQLIARFRARDQKVAVLAIDPTSPFTGGAILGDRIRMQRHFADRGVFIRSVATRGALGGLSRSAADIIRVLDAWQADVVLVETVGVGQDELEVTRTVDSTLVVMAPGMGDEVQAIKAGILECADVFAVNKADRDGADATQRDLELMIALGDVTRPKPGVGHVGAGLVAPSTPAEEVAEHWRPPVLPCVSTKGKGVDALVDALDSHRRWLLGTEGGRERRRARLGEAMRHQLRNTLIEYADIQMGGAIDEAVDRVARREVDPYTAADELVDTFRRIGREQGGADG